jgi:hypothetical protein
VSVLVSRRVESARRNRRIVASGINWPSGSVKLPVRSVAAAVRAPKQQTQSSKAEQRR